MDYKGMTVADLDALLDEVKEARKVALLTEQAKVDEGTREYLATLEKGAPLTVVYKGEETLVTFEKLTEKRFTVLVDGVKRSIMFDKLIV